jgi:hypothetical protein
MDMQARHQLTLSVLPRYLKANKGAKKRILDEYCANTGYHRKHAIRELREYHLTHWIKGEKPGKHRRRREKVYDMRVEAALATVWNAYGGMHMIVYVLNAYIPTLGKWFASSVHVVY